MNRPADWRQRELGREPGQSYIVQAPAGSGKTELLAQRMLGLLAHVDNPEEVVAITFTRKAAAEMQHRVLGRLETARSCTATQRDALPPHERLSIELAQAALANDAGRGWNLLRQPGRLRIRTIDSLCHELARQLPVLSGLGGGHQVTGDASALYRQAAAMTLGAIEDGSDELQQDIVRVLGRYDNRYDRLLDLITGMLPSREQWARYVLAAIGAPGGGREDLERALRCLVEAQLAETLGLIPGALLSELPGYYRYALDNGSVNHAALVALLQACGGSGCKFLELSASAGALEHWITFIDTLLTKGGTARKSVSANDGFPPPSRAPAGESERLRAHKEGFLGLLEKHLTDHDLLASLDLVRRLPGPAYDDEAWGSLESLMRILVRALANWKLVMAAEGRVDYAEVVGRAINALGSDEAPSELALRLDYRISHILVDEFQDTSSNQVELLEQLTAGWQRGDGRTLFLVGDPMQSIYRFRKAEVSLFIEAWHGRLFKHVGLKQLQLSVNFRSTLPIVQWVNETFPAVMPAQDDPVMGAVRYSAAGTRPGVSQEGCVKLRMLPGRDDLQEAHQVADAIDGLDGEVAVLVRARSHASAILAEFDRRRVSDTRFHYKAIEFTPLSATPLVTDLVSLTLALQQPADSLAWLAVLRSPCVGLQLADLDALVLGRGWQVVPGMIAEQLDSACASLSADGRPRLMRAGPLLLEALSRRGKLPASDLVENTWVALGGPACVEHDGQLLDAKSYFALLDDLSGEGHPLDRDTLDERLQGLYAQPDSRASGQLQIMTIYQAKGLQFDHVLLPGLHRSPDGAKDALLHWFELAGTNQFVLSPMRNSEEKQNPSGDLASFVSSVENKRQRLENGRLLYVAATRAIETLHLFGAAAPKADGSIAPRANSLLQSLWPAIEATQAPLLIAAGTPDTGTDDEPAPRSLPQVWQRLDSGWRTPQPPSPVDITPADRVETGENIEFDWAGEEARLAGNLVHRALQVIGEDGLDAYATDGALAATVNWFRQHLRSRGCHGEIANRVIDRARLAIETCLASERGRWILSRHESARCEYAITVIEGKHPRGLVLDRTFIHEGVRWIIDYKTSSHTGGSIEDFLANEKKRHGEQLRGYQKAMTLVETLPVKTALYFPLLDRFEVVD